MLIPSEVLYRKPEAYLEGPGEVRNSLVMGRTGVIKGFLEVL